MFKKPLATAVFGAFLVLVSGSAHADGKAATPTAEQPNAEQPDVGFINQVAHFLIIEEMGLDPETVFEPAGVHPQSHKGYYAVIGRLKTKNFVGKWQIQSYIAGVLQTCENFRDLEGCWKLQRLAIDNAFVIDNGPPPKKL